MKEIRLDMVLSVPDSETEESIFEKFLGWVESNGWAAGGGIKDITGEVYDEE